jgi:hypothetical protein
VPRESAGNAGRAAPPSALQARQYIAALSSADHGARGAHASPPPAPPLGDDEAAEDEDAPLPEDHVEIEKSNVLILVSAAAAPALRWSLAPGCSAALRFFL